MHYLHVAHREEIIRFIVCNPFRSKDVLMHLCSIMIIFIHPKCPVSYILEPDRDLTAILMTYSLRASLTFLSSPKSSCSFMLCSVMSLTYVLPAPLWMWFSCSEARYSGSTVWWWLCIDDSRIPLSLIKVVNKWSSEKWEIGDKLRWEKWTKLNRESVDTCKKCAYSKMEEASFWDIAHWWTHQWIMMIVYRFIFMSNQSFQTCLWKF